MSITIEMFQREQRHDYWLWPACKQYCAMQSNDIFNETLQLIIVIGMMKQRSLRKNVA